LIVDGEWAAWNSWASCSVSCKTSGSNPSGTWTRTRTCTNPAPKYDGKQCVGSGSQQSSCTTSTYCPGKDTLYRYIVQIILHVSTYFTGKTTNFSTWQTINYYTCKTVCYILDGLWCL